MSTHVPSSPFVCLHSVCIAPAHRRKGVGLLLLQEYLARLERQRAGGSASYKQVMLITHEELRPFYERAGFEWIGKSDVRHGSRPWYEMRRTLGSPLPSLLPETEDAHPSAQPLTEVPPIPAALWETLQRPSRRRLVSLPLSSFPGGISDVVAAQDAPSNKFDLLCPRSECASIILKSGVAKWVESPSVQVNVPPLSKNSSHSHIAVRWNLRDIPLIPFSPPSQLHLQ